MHARIVGGEFNGVEFEVSDTTIDNIRKVEKYQDVKKYCRENKVYSAYHVEFVAAKTGGYNYVRVPLPTCNDLWTFAAFDWVKTFCEHFNNTYSCWPHHNTGLDCVNYLWIKV